VEEPALRLVLALALCLSQDAPLDEALRAHPTGFAVAVDAGDAALRLGAGGRRIVHALEADPARLRAAADAKGLAGIVTVERWSADALPYAEHVVNLLVSGRPLPEAEARRVLAPGGTAILPGRTLRRERPKDFDDWTHWRHGADGNMVSKDRAVAAPQGLRWVAGPAQDGGGKKWYYDHILLAAEGRNIYVTEDGLVARDSWNGSILWTRAFKAHTFREAGVPLAPESPKTARPAARQSKVRPVLDGPRLYAATEGKLLELDAATGETKAELAEVKNPRELLVDGGLLVVTEAAAIRAYEKRALKWQAPVAARRLVAGDGALFAVTEREVVALDRATGRELWRVEDPEAPLVLTATYSAGTLVLEKSTLRDDPFGCGIRVYDAKEGKLLWTKDYKPDMTHYREARAWFARGMLWIQGDKEKLIGCDPKTGSERVEWKTRGKHCATPVATERFFMAPECEFTDLENGEQSRARMFKSACRLPFIPANGLLYTFPVQCECWPMLRGYMGLASSLPAEIAAGPRRIEGSRAAPQALLKPAGDEWPTYRHDAWRSGATPMKLAVSKVAWETSVAAPASGPVAEDWKSNPYVKGPVTPPVVAGGLVLAAVPDAQRVVALDARTGKPAWTHLAGTRVDGPPTVFEDLCLFGAHDGWVTALRLSDGSPAWRFRAAPREARLPAYGQVESPWPAVGSVLVDGGIAYAAAGRHPSADGGVQVVALQARTGELVWEKTVSGLDEIQKWYGGTLTGVKTKIGLDFEPVDLLVRDGDRVSMSRWRFAPVDGEFKLQLDSTTYLAPGGLAVPRGLWGYGIRQTKQVLPKNPAVFDEAKLHAGAKGDQALLLADGTLWTATGTELRAGERAIALPAPAVFDGLAAAYGRLYVATEKGTLVCIE
jgi:outer membrane protein assembly factor BamB